MNITDSFIKEIGGKIGEIIGLNKEIQIYSDHDIFKYLWVDSNFEETSNLWRNTLDNKLQTRGELKESIINHITNKYLNEK